MKEEMRNILLMGLGAISLTGEKANELRKELLEKGEILYKKGEIKNEELKRNIKDKIKENTNFEFTKVTKEDLVEMINDMSDEEKAEIAELLKNSNKENETEENKEENNKDPEE